jgi:hypothetical protein
MTGNSATQAGGIFQIADAHSLTLSGTAITGNSAFGGALGFIVSEPVPPITLSALTLTANTASAGALYFANSGTVTPVACTGCSVSNNTASLYGPVIATMPTQFNASAAATTRSGRLLPPISVALYDAYGQQVGGWPDLLLSIETSGTGMSGGTKVAYARGAAAFDLLTITDVEGASYGCVRGRCSRTR